MFSYKQFQHQAIIEEKEKTLANLLKEKQDLKAECQAEIKSKDQQIATVKLEAEKVGLVIFKGRKLKLRKSKT